MATFQDPQNAGKTAREIFLEGMSRMQKLDNKQAELMNELKKWDYGKAMSNGGWGGGGGSGYMQPKTFYNPKIERTMLPDNVLMFTYALPAGMEINDRATVGDPSMSSDLKTNHTKKTKIVKIFVSYE